MTPPAAAPDVYPPAVPALAVGTGGGVLLFPSGEIETVAANAGAQAVLERHRPMVCHRLHVARRLGVSWFPAFDLMELFAFVRPAVFVAPTPRGLMRALELPVPATLEQEAQALPDAVMRLFRILGRTPERERSIAFGIAAAMARGGWEWGPFVLAALGKADGDVSAAAAARAMAVWDRLPEISECAPEPGPGTVPVAADEARVRLRRLLGDDAESRPQQADYASAVCGAFEPRRQPGEPGVVLAEAGTGVGKTLGYIAPASVWSEKNGGCVWISTYTRNLQRQLDAELDRLYPDPPEKARYVVVRKGRENYLCLLNVEEAMRRIAATPQEAVSLGLMVRWADRTADGSLIGGDFPGWLVDSIGRDRSLALADRRGECLFGGCDHLDRCFIERAIRRARRARLVVANHALVLVQAAMAGLDDDTTPSRYIFDEGHHLFDAADSAFSVHFSALEGMELRRWLLGGDGGSGGFGGRSRARGLRRRADGLIDPESEAGQALEQALSAADCLPGVGWAARLAGDTPHGPIEAFLGQIRRQVYARTRSADGPHRLETEVHPPLPDLVDQGREAARALSAIVDPLNAFSAALLKRLETEAETLETALRHRIEATARSLDRRALTPLRTWARIAADLAEPTPEAFVDWLTVDRGDGQDADVGLRRHWIDPTRPFAAVLARQADGALITSATLRDNPDGADDPEAVWVDAERRTGAVHLTAPPLRAFVPSPFDYPALTRVLVVTDVNRDEPDQVAAAVSALFRASGGGALGLFTAVSRLRSVCHRIAPDLEQAGLPLYAQHVDAMDVSTLVSIFREEEDACLLGTDAVRDGVDVPGRSLRLIVFDRVPWPRPDILHKARRTLWGGPRYDDKLTRHRLKQAFGRLVRTARDRGVFVMLDARMPSRLCSAFPSGVAIERIGLAEAVRIVRDHEFSTDSPRSGVL